MVALLPFLVLIPTILAGVLPDVILDDRAENAVSQNLTCGITGAGQNRGETCPQASACCSSYGYCGSTEAFCLTTAGCQSRYSNSTAACGAPKPGQSITIDGTCGTTGAGKVGYRCNSTGLTCCSASGYCGNTTDHCGDGCQSTYGTCAKKSVILF